MAHVTCLDVGHGNCSIISCDDATVVIDAGPGSSLLEYIDANEIVSIDLILISHADADHLAGLTALLAADHVSISRVALNADAIKSSDAWDDIAYTLSCSSLNRRIKLDVGWHIGEASDFQVGDLFLKTIAPTPYLTAKGAGGKDREGRKITSNSLSSVVRVDYMGDPVALLPGDLDVIGLDAFLEALDIDPTLAPAAPILVWPHHGGKPGSGSPREFARKLMDLVMPQHVVFSNGRAQGKNPRPEIVAEILRSNAVPRISCTQLSRACASQRPALDAWDLHDLPGRGRVEGRGCSGSLQFQLHDPTEDTIPALEAHQNFISAHAPTPMCRL